jgi:hypothetical protein
MEHSFQKIESSSAGVSLGIKTTLDLMLQITGSTAGVTVAASAAVLNTGNADLDTAVELAYIDNAPGEPLVQPPEQPGAQCCGGWSRWQCLHQQSAFSMVVGNDDLGKQRSQMRARVIH